MLKVGELARRTGLTVRTLHHYDSIGLLSPSARSDAGYRLYHRGDITRLHQIQAMRRLGMALAEIGAFLASPASSLGDVVARQIAALDHQLAEAAKLRAQLTALQRQFQLGEDPDLASWLTTLELMSMYDKYFSKDELNQLPLYQNSDADAEWATLLAEVQGSMEAGIPPSAPAMQELGKRWMVMLERDTAGNPSFAARLDRMLSQEPLAQQQTGVTPQIRQYVVAAFSEFKLSMYAQYMLPEEIATMRRHYSGRAREWPALLEAISVQMQADPSPVAPQAKILARQWLELLHDMLGMDPDTLPRFRKAHENLPILQTGSWMTPAMLAYLRTATS